MVISDFGLKNMNAKSEAQFKVHNPHSAFELLHPSS